MIKKLMPLLMILSITITASCSRIMIHDTRINTHWIKKGDIAPFNGILMTQYTFYKIIKRIEECKIKQ